MFEWCSARYESYQMDCFDTYSYKSALQDWLFKGKVWSFWKFWIWQPCYFTELPWDHFAWSEIVLNSKILIISHLLNQSYLLLKSTLISASTKTWMVDPETFHIQPGPPLNIARSGHSCAKMILNVRAHHMFSRIL